MSSALHPPAKVPVFETRVPARAHREGESDPSGWVTLGIVLLVLLPFVLGTLKLAGMSALAWGWVVSPLGILLPVLFAGLLLMAE